MLSIHVINKTLIIIYIYIYIRLIWIIVKIFKKPNRAVTDSGIDDPIELKQNSVYSTYIKHNQDCKGNVCVCVLVYVSVVNIAYMNLIIT